MKLILLKIELLNFRTTWKWKILENFEFEACKELWSMLLRQFHNIIPIFWSYLGQFGSNSGSLWLVLTNRWLGNTIITACSFPPLESRKRKNDKFRNQWLPLTVECRDDWRVPKWSGPELGCWKKSSSKIRFCSSGINKCWRRRIMLVTSLRRPIWPLLWQTIFYDFTTRNVTTHEK